MFSIQIFEPTGAEVASFIEPGTGVCWFHAGSMAETLEFTTPSRYLPTVLQPHEYKEVKQSSTGRPSLYVREEGVYILIMRSKSPWASEFQRWLAYDVLPSIRKTGSFGGVPNSKSGGSEFWNLIDNAMARQIEPERAIDLHHRFNGHASVETSAELAEPKTRTSKGLSNQGRKTELLGIVRRKWGDQPFTVRDVCRASIKFGSANNIKSLLDQLLADGDIQKRRVGTKTQYQLP